MSTLSFPGRDIKMALTVLFKKGQGRVLAVDKEWQSHGNDFNDQPP